MTRIVFEQQFGDIAAVAPTDDIIVQLAEIHGGSGSDVMHVVVERSGAIQQRVAAVENVEHVDKERIVRATQLVDVPHLVLREDIDARRREAILDVGRWP